MSSDAPSSTSPDALRLNEALLLLSEGLDLCVRARKLDEELTKAIAVGDGSSYGGTRCGTPAFWVQDAYDRDLAAWEERARLGLSRLAPFVTHLPAPSGLTHMLSASLDQARDGATLQPKGGLDD